MDNYGSLIDALIQSELEGSPKHEQILQLGETPDYLVSRCGFPALPLSIKGSTVSKAAFDHGIPKSLLKRLPSILASDPRCLFLPSDPQKTDSIVVLTIEFHREHPVVVPIRMNQRVGRNQWHNLVVSVYGKEGPDPEAKWKEDGLLIWEPQADS